jgi:hypothetical protein
METGHYLTAPDQSSAVQPTPPRKGYLTEEQARVVNLLRQYEKAYISQSSKSGNFLVLNGDITEHIRNSTLAALSKKGFIEKLGVGKWKLIE